MSKDKKKAVQPPRRPERKIGPFGNGLAINIWLNEVEVNGEIRYFRSVTISPRRYRDTDGKWQDANSYRPIDLATLCLAMEEARRYMAATPLPGQPVEGEEYEELHDPIGDHASA